MWTDTTLFVHSQISWTKHSMKGKKKKMTRTSDVLLNCFKIHFLKFCYILLIPTFNQKQSLAEFPRMDFPLLHTRKLLWILSKIVCVLPWFIPCFFENIIHILICSPLDHVSTQLWMWMNGPVDGLPEYPHPPSLSLWIKKPQSACRVVPPGLT